jgi:hypothetical protein
MATPQQHRGQCGIGHYERKIQGKDQPLDTVMNNSW